jgi:2-polyprenyl-3-methyl-5-hydroxy-6-metoxy-1,4-benzoquinol methylase
MTMVGLAEQNDNNFTPEKYEEFYEHHYFEPIPEALAYTVNEVIPRFGWAFDEVEQISPKTLLDLGCLDGSFANSVADQLGVTVTGVDLTQEGIDLAIQRAKAKSLPATFFQGTVEDWLQTFIDKGQKFDVVTFFEIIEHVKDVQLCLKLIDQVLAPGGSVLVSTPDFESPHYGMNDEQNTCHVRLYTTADEDYEKENIFGHVRKATSISKEIGPERIKHMEVRNELINVRYE